MLPIPPKLSTNDVHVWYRFLDQPIVHDAQYLIQLSPDERERAARFFVDHTRYEFIASRIFLRSVLARYLNIEPGAIAFHYGLRGKPMLDFHSSLRFNMSHTRGIALLAITSDREIGVDIEHIRSIPETDAVVNHYFSPAEIAVFMALPEQEKLAAFFRCWTRKEAFIKACGDGLTIPLNSFDVSFAPGESPRLLRVENRISELERWTICDIHIMDKYATALCVEGDDWKLSSWEWK